MSLEYAILGFLNYHPYTGYDLKKIFETSIKHFWSADQSQIYRTLIHLSEQDYAKMEKVPQEDRPDRKLYSITVSGRQAFLNWLSHPPSMEEPRSAALVQVFFAGNLDDNEVLAKFEEFAAIMRVLLARYEKVPEMIAPYQQEFNSPRENFFWMLTLDNGLRTMHANLEWAEHVIKQIKTGQVPPKQEGK
jgi:DNA-binding PadR family transcriptional regulator